MTEAQFQLCRLDIGALVERQQHSVCVFSNGPRIRIDLREGMHVPAVPTDTHSGQPAQISCPMQLLLRRLFVM